MNEQPPGSRDKPTSSTDQTHQTLAVLQFKCVPSAHFLPRCGHSRCSVICVILQSHTPEGIIMPVLKNSAGTFLSFAQLQNNWMMRWFCNLILLSPFRSCASPNTYFIEVVEDCVTALQTALWGKKEDRGKQQGNYEAEDKALQTDLTKTWGKCVESHWFSLLQEKQTGREEIYLDKLRWSTWQFPFLVLEFGPRLFLSLSLFFLAAPAESWLLTPHAVLPWWEGEGVRGS